MTQRPLVTYQRNYTKKDLDEIFERLLKYETDYSKELVEIRKEQILKRSNSFFIIDLLEDLADLIGREQNEYTEFMMEHIQDQLIQLHSPVIFNIPINLDPFHKWEQWTFEELYQYYWELAMNKGWTDYYKFHPNPFEIDYSNIKNYHILDMVNDLIINDYKICGYEIRSFLNTNGFLPEHESGILLQSFNPNCLIDVKLKEKYTREELKELPYKGD